MSDNKNNPKMDENFGSSFDDNPFAKNSFTDDNSSSFSTDTTPSVAESENSDLGNNTNFSNEHEFGVSSDFGSSSEFGTNSEFGSNSEFAAPVTSDNFGENQESNSGSSNDAFGLTSFDSNPFASESASSFGEAEQQFTHTSAPESEGPLGSNSNFATPYTAPEINNTTKQGYKQGKKDNRDVTKELTISEYKQRINELNRGAENKHYVLFFGRPGSGKTFIIGSLINYLKSRSPGHTVYRDENTTLSEDKKYYEMVDYYQSGKVEEMNLGSTDGKQYYEFPFTFTPTSNPDQPVELVFVDCAGEHTQRSMYDVNKKERTGALPNYITAILESDVNVKICFVYDYVYDTKNKRTGIDSQINNLISVYNEILHYQKQGIREFSKLMLMSKADMYRDVMRKYQGSALKFALIEAPAFANTFENENKVFRTKNKNSFTFYSVGEFLLDSDSLLEDKLDYKSPHKIIKWLYEGATGASLVPKKYGFFKSILHKLGIID